MLSIFGVIFLAGVLEAGYLAYSKSVRDQTASELDAIRKAGHPVTLDELQTWYPPVPDEENAARLYEAAFKQFTVEVLDRFSTLPLVGKGIFPQRGRPLPPELMSEIEMCLRANESALALLAQGATRKRCRYSLDLKQGVGCNMKRDDVRHGVRLLLLKSIFAAECLKPREALESVDHAVRLSITLTHVPIYSDSECGLHCLLEAQNAVERIMSRLPLSSDDLDGMMDTWKSAYDSGMMQRMMISERCLGISEFDDVRNTAVSENPRLGKIYRWLILDNDKLEYLKLMKRVVRTGDNTLPLSERAKDWETAVLDLEMLNGAYVLTKTLIPAAGWYLGSETKMLARLRALRAAVAVERYRLAKGVLPQELDEIIPAFLDVHPQDPYNGGPLLYEKRARGYVIYCVGPDGKNDGGKEPEDDEDPKDVTFTIER